VLLCCRGVLLCCRVDVVCGCVDVLLCWRERERGGSSEKNPGTTRASSLAGSIEYRHCNRANDEV